MAKLAGRVAVVAGASRGAGRGIALALGDAGATVYVLGRTSRNGPKPADGAPGTVEDTASEVTLRGGVGIAVQADLTAPPEVAAVFERVTREQGRLDVLANAVWSAGEASDAGDDFMASMQKPFWEQWVTQWPATMGAVHAYWLASCQAARVMAASRGGLIVGVTDGVMGDGISGTNPGDYGGQLLWDLAHTSINRMLYAMSVEAKKRKIAVVTLMPGFMRTERVLQYLKSEELKKLFRLDLSETPEYLGRAVAALAADAKVMKKTGTIQFVADLAREYGFTDVDGRVVPRFNPFGATEDTRV